MNIQALIDTLVLILYFYTASVLEQQVLLVKRRKKKKVKWKLKCIMNSRPSSPDYIQITKHIRHQDLRSRLVCMIEDNKHAHMIRHGSNPGQHVPSLTDHIYCKN